MTGKIIRQKYISRAEVRANYNKFYVFGDNMIREGFGGQAKEMRGEPNTIGIPTKWRPNTNIKSFFSDADYDYIGVRLSIENSFHMIERVLEEGFDVIIPKDGIGTGLAKLNVTAPKIFKIIEDKIEELERKYK